MPLLGLPNELILEIAEQLDHQRDISVLCRVNRRFQHLLTDVLLEHNIRHHKSSALIWAAWNGHINLAGRLLDVGADVNTMTERGTTPVLQAAVSGYKDMVRLFIERGADKRDLDWFRGGDRLSMSRRLDMSDTRRL